jgi:2-C-methyl-D-erythritol 4-phosphate cytidylyltransferase
MNHHLILVAGGTGTRMQQTLPKQFLPLADEPVMAHTLRVFHRFDPSLDVVVVMHSDYIGYWKELCAQLNFPVAHRVVPGGRERFHSVKAGLDAIEGDTGVVGIHDAVRPLVSEETIRRAYDAARESGAAVPVVPVHESLRAVHGEVSEAVDRSSYRLVQTPQCFRLEVLRDAFRQEYQPHFTDDASVAEAAGHRIALTAGNRENIKLTTPEDLIMAEALLAHRAASR